VDWIGARLLGYEPQRVPLVREALGDFQWPIASFDPVNIRLLGDWKTGRADQVFLDRENPMPVIHPIGWRDAAYSVSRIFT
jgi:hypothetical protein